MLRVMARSNRVRQLSTRALEQELQRFLCEPPFPDEREQRAEARAERVARELARRDYRFRAHGRECTCEACTGLHHYWLWLGRRGDWEIHRGDE